jgi:hypothetical protein
MDDFLASLRQESVSYRKTSLRIDNFRRKLNVCFDDLQVAANHRVFQIPKPVSVLEQTEAFTSRTANRPITQMVSARPQTARPRPTGRGAEAAKPPEVLWVTQSIGRPKMNLFSASSHHFDPDFPIMSEPPKTARVCKTPITVRRMQTVRNPDY